MPTFECIGAPTDGGGGGGGMRLPGCCETHEHETGVEGHEAGGGRGHEAGGESDIEAASGGRTVLEGRGQLSSPPLDLSINPPHIGMATYRHGKASPFPGR